jgi:hypothetical protein
MEACEKSIIAMPYQSENMARWAEQFRIFCAHLFILERPDVDNLPMSDDRYIELKKKFDLLLAENVRLQENTQRLKVQFALIGLGAPSRAPDASQLRDAHVDRAVTEG